MQTAVTQLGLEILVPNFAPGTAQIQKLARPNAKITLHKITSVAEVTGYTGRYISGAYPTAPTVELWLSDGGYIVIVRANAFVSASGLAC